jgi:ubiquinone/menaquinone biosynthesis C-methylase UbiE
VGEAAQPGVGPPGEGHGRDFYDDLAAYYDLVYADWEGAMDRQARAVLQVVEPLASTRAGPLRILDVSAGIGTQALPLAARGLEVTARDLSPEAVDRLRREAEARGLEIDAGVGDMRRLQVAAPFDAVISFDNSVPHLLDDEAIAAAFREAHRVAVDEGLLVISVRDYAEIRRGRPSVQRYGERRRGDRVFDVRQEWEWIDRDHYRTTMIVEELGEDGGREVVRTTATYYAVGLPRLLELMDAAGFEAGVADGVDFFQPILVGRKLP